MDFLAGLLSDAVRELFGFGGELRRILFLTLAVAGSATLIGILLGIPLGAWLALTRHRFRNVIDVVVNAGMGVPPVLAGLLILILLWNDGPLGSLELVFTPIAMIGAQALLAVPIAAGITAGAIRGLGSAANEQLFALALSGPQRALVAAREAFPGVVAAVAAAFGRVVSEVGAVLIVGGNIEGETQVLTTAIVQQARQAHFDSALALGMVLLMIVLLVNVALGRLRAM